MTLDAAAYQPTAMHIDRAKLADFATGRLQGDEAESVETHLLECEECGRLLDELDLEDDGLIGFLRTGTTSTAGQHAASSNADPPRPVFAAGLATERDLPRNFGRYRLEKVLGRGGMGVVYKANDTTLHRHVALKVIAPHRLVEGDNRNRFRREAESAARLQHANIVQIFEFGEEGSTLYCAFEFVDGESLADRLRRGRLSGKEAAAMVATLAQAVAYAHERRIVHRDLKPANVLFTANNTPKIADFGLAKRLDDEVSNTKDGTLLGSPCYMAPEQAGADRAAIGPLVDVYALGVVLYESLVGEPPFLSRDVWTTLDQVRRQDPIPPSRRQSDVDEDLNSICLKCLEKRPEDRYVSADELGTDLRRFLDDMPTLARRPTWWQRGKKLVKRHPLASFLSTMIALGLLGFVATVLMLNVSLQEALEDATDMKGLAEQNADRERHANLQLAQSNEQLQRTLDQQERNASALQLRRVAASARDDNALAHAMLQQCPERLRDFCWQYLNYAHASRRDVAEWDNGGSVTSLAVTPGGEAFLTGDDEGVIRIWSFDHSEPQLVIADAHQDDVTDIAFAADGRLFATASKDGAARVWDWESRTPSVELCREKEDVNGVAFSPTQSYVATAHSQRERNASDAEDASLLGMVRIWQLPGGQLVTELQGHEDSAFRVSFTADGACLVSGSRDGRLCVWEEKYDWLRHEHYGFGTDLACHPRIPNMLAVAGIFAQVHVGQLRSFGQLSQQPVWRRADGRLSSVAFARDGLSLAAVSYDGVIQIHDLEGGAVKSLRQPAEKLTAVRFRNQDQVLTGTASGRVVQWDVSDRGQPLRIDAHAGRAIAGMAILADRSLASIGADGSMRFWNLDDGRLLQESTKVHSEALGPVFIRADRLAWEVGGVVNIGRFADQRLASGETPADLLLLNTPVRVQDLDDPSPEMPADLLFLSALALSKSAEALAVLDFNGLRFIDPTSGRRLWDWSLEEVSHLAPAPNSERIAVASDRTRVGIAQLHDRRFDLLADLRDSFSDRTPIISCLNWSPDERRLAAGLASGDALILDVTTGKPMATLSGHKDTVTCLTWSADDQTMATGSSDGSVRLWDPVIGAERLVLATPSGVTTVAFTSDGTTLTAGCEDGSVMIWSTR